jgi:fatty-acyl-CoA synthase
MSAAQNQYSIGLDKTPANYVPLTPLSFLARSAAVYPDHVSTVYEDRSFTWSETYARCKRFASYLAGRGIGHGDTVAAMLPNIPAMNELHFAVPMAGAVLNASTSGSMRPRSHFSSITVAQKSSWSIPSFPA